MMSGIYSKIIQKEVEHGVLSILLFHHQLIIEVFEFIILNFIFFYMFEISYYKKFFLKGKQLSLIKFWFSMFVVDLRVFIFHKFQGDSYNEEILGKP